MPLASHLTTTVDNLKFGLLSPLQNYYHFNCSRKTNVRLTTVVYAVKQLPEFITGLEL